MTVLLLAALVQGVIVLALVVSIGRKLRRRRPDSKRIAIKHPQWPEDGHDQ
jgi:hypothetical protein